MVEIFDFRDFLAKKLKFENSVYKHTRVCRDESNDTKIIEIG